MTGRACEYGRAGMPDIRQVMTRGTFRNALYTCMRGIIRAGGLRMVFNRLLYRCSL